MITRAFSTAIRPALLLLLGLFWLGSQATVASAQTFDAYSFVKSSSSIEGENPLELGERLFEINPATGVQQELGFLSLGSFSSAQMTTLPAVGQIAALFDLGSDPRVALVDPANLYVLSVQAVSTPVAGIAANPFNSALYVTHGSPASNRLGILNPSTGNVQDLGQIAFASAATAIDILAFSPAGELWGLELVKSQQSMNLWRIDPGTRAAVLVGSTPRHVAGFDDAVFLGNELWVLRSSDNHVVKLSQVDASVLLTAVLDGPKKYGIAVQSCAAPSPAVVAGDNPADAGGVILLDWSAYVAPANLLRFDIVRSSNSCDVAGGGATVIASIVAGQEQIFEDTAADNYTTYFYGIQVIVDVQGQEQILEQLGSGAAVSFPNVLINEFAPAGGVSKSSSVYASIMVGEFVELFNLASVPIDLTGWLLSNGTETEALSGIIPGNGLFVHTVAVIDLPDAGGLFELLPPGGGGFVIDDVAYGSEGGAPTAPSGFTINRVEGTDSTTPDEKAFSTGTPSPNQTNAAVPPNLGGSLVLNEVFYQGTSAEDYIELFNPTGGTIALQRFAVSDGVTFIDTLDTNLDVAPGAWFVLNANSLDPFVRNLNGTQLYLYKITETGLFELVDHLGWGPGIGDPTPPGPDAVNTTLVRNADGDALYLGDIGTNWIECGGDVTLFYGPPSPGGANSSPQLPSILVDQSGAGDFRTIAEALAVATAGIRILVAPGIYEERFNLKDGVSISGIGVLPTQVIIAGPGGHTPLQAFGVGSSTEVSRVSIRGGYAAADGPFAQTPASGGGLRVVSGSPVFKNVRFEYNLANNNGGAIAIAGGTPLFEGCQFLNNFSNDAGGAIWMVAGNATFRSCLFVGNKSGTDGGVAFVEGGTLNFEQCVMDNNVATGTGIIHAAGGSTLMEFSIITSSFPGELLSAVAPGAIQFGCGLMNNSSTEEGSASALVQGAVTTFNLVQGDPLYCQPLAFNYAYPDASPIRQLTSSCEKIIGIAGAPCGQVLTDADNAPVKRTMLHTPYPNPFNPAVLLRFDLAVQGRAELVVYDVRGRRLVELLGGAVLRAGTHQAEWRGLDSSGRALGSGIYFARLRVDGADVGGIQKMVLLK